jgi:hypothetical protein
MKTDQLIGLLATQPGAVDPLRAARGVLLASGIGIALSLALMAIALGPNPALVDSATGSPMFWVKFGFVGAFAAAAMGVLMRLARPGMALGRAVHALAAPVAILWVLASLALLAAEPGQRLPLVTGQTWTLCPWLIAALSVPSFVSLMYAVRSLAPTRLRLAGAGAGLLAGALGACVYQFHCPELAAPFLGVWYVLGMLIPAGVGALVGPRVLRW